MDIVLDYEMPGSAIAKKTILVLVLDAFLVFISKSPLYTKIHRNEEDEVQSDERCTATNKGYLTSFKKTTNPNVSPIGKRFGFECFGADDGTRLASQSCLLAVTPFRLRTCRLNDSPPDCRF